MDASGRLLRVRSIVGRSRDLYRGASPDATTPREPSPARPLGELVAALRTIATVTVTQERTRIVVSRGEDHEDLAIHVDVDPVALPDLRFEGSTELAIAALHAWVPTFGAAELRDDDYSVIVDETEPVEVIAHRFGAKARADLAKATARIADVGSDEPVSAPRATRRQRAMRIAVIVGVAVMVPLAGLWAFRLATRRAPLGAACTSNRQCESSECLSGAPRAPLVDGLGDDSPVARGACTLPCAEDRDCPATMACEQAELASPTPKVTFRVRRCTPRDWAIAP